jgi:FdhD protein
MESFKITRIMAGAKEAVEDIVAEEVPLRIFVNKSEPVTLLCTPQDLHDLIRGFLFSSGLIEKSADVKEIALDRKQWRAFIELDPAHETGKSVKKSSPRPFRSAGAYPRSGNGRGSRCVIKISRVRGLVADFQKRSDIYIKTGGVHSAAIADNKNILVFREDIGRHNAMDKVIGHMMLENDFFGNKIIITSGRISSEVIFKVRKCGVPIIISKSAPTAQAVRLGREKGITLVGFARGNRMNIYSGQARIRE